MPHQIAQRIVERVQGGKMLFLVGSGISSPAGLPTAADLLGATGERYLPSSAPETTRVLKLIQPEIFYEELALFLGQDAFRAFTSLATQEVEPTLAHYVLVTLAARASLPIVTTNFDCLFERASQDLGIESMAVGPDGPFDIYEGRASIWKVHGSIIPGEPKSVTALGSTMTKITAPNERLLKALRSYAFEGDLCLVGYSGRDIDLFPNLREVAPHSRIYWFDTNPDNVLTRATRADAHLVHGTLEGAIELVQPELLTEIQSKVPSARSSPSLSRSRLTDLLRKAVDAGPSLPEHSKDLLLATCLYRIGDPTAAALHLASNEAEHLFNNDLVHRAQTRILMAQVSDALSDYCTSERHSSHAIRLARQMGKSQPSPLSTALLLHGLHGLAMARKMQLGPAFPFEVPEVNFRVRRFRALLILVQYVIGAIWMRLLLRKMAAQPDRISDQRLDLWAQRGRNRYYDHVLILIALLEGGLGRVTIVRRALQYWLMSIHKRAQEQGDWRILPHVLKQIQRLTGGDDDEVSFAEHAYELTGDPLNRALLARNAGERLLGEGNLLAAQAKFLEALESAKKCGSRATGLKALVGLYVCGETISWEDARAVFTGLTGEGYERFAELFAPLAIDQTRSPD